MARRIDTARTVAGDTPAAVADAHVLAEQLGILYPEGTMAIAGRVVIMREYGYLEGLRLLPQVQPLTDALYALLDREALAPPSADAISEVVATHVDLVAALVAQAMTPWQDDAAAMAGAIADNRQWLETLNATDGDACVLLWWGVNGRFFIRRVLQRAARDIEAAKAGSRSAPPGSVTP